MTSNSTTVVQTNARHDSVRNIETTTLKFSDLWKNYPETSAPCLKADGSAAFDDQCAIRLGVALERSGISNRSFKGVRCWDGAHPPSHMLRAQEVADWLKRHPFAGCPQTKELAGPSWRKHAKGRQGIIFFKDYWIRSGARQATGDHIDLWDGQRLTSSSASSAVNGFFRFALGIDSAWYSNLGESKLILLWELA